MAALDYDELNWNFTNSGVPIIVSEIPMKFCTAHSSMASILCVKYKDLLIKYAL